MRLFGSRGPATGAVVAGRRGGAYCPRALPRQRSRSRHPRPRFRTAIRWGEQWPMPTHDRNVLSARCWGLQAPSGTGEDGRDATFAGRGSPVRRRRKSWATRLHRRALEQPARWPASSSARRSSAGSTSSNSVGDARLIHPSLISQASCPASGSEAHTRSPGAGRPGETRSGRSGMRSSKPPSGRQEHRALAPVRGVLRLPAGLDDGDRLWARQIAAEVLGGDPVGGLCRGRGAAGPRAGRSVRQPS